MNKVSTSLVWEKFKRVNKTQAECTICNKVLKCDGGSTKGLLYHLAEIHNINSKRPVEAENQCSKFLQ